MKPNKKWYSFNQNRWPSLRHNGGPLSIGMVVQFGLESVVQFGQEYAL